MMSKTFESSDRQTLGWLTAGLLFLALSSQAWALDLDKSISRQESESAQILSSLGRGKSANQVTSQQTRKTVQVQLMRKNQRPDTVVR